MYSYQYGFLVECSYNRNSCDEDSTWLGEKSLCRYTLCSSASIQKFS